MMRRREFALSVAAALALPFEVQTQQQAQRIGLLRLAPLDPTGHFLAVVGGGLKARRLRLLVVDASGGSDRLSAAARQLVAQNPDVVITFGDPSIKAMQQATTSIPIVAMTDDMVRSGLVASLAQPGGNTTGLSILTSELDVKRLELLHEAVPQATRIGILEDRSTVQIRSRLEEAAPRLGVELVIACFGSFDEVARAADRIAASGVGAVNVLATPLIGLSDIDPVIDRLNHAGLPAIYQWPEFANRGGYLAYGSDIKACYRQVAGIAERLLRGAKPGDVPVEQPTKFDLTINMKTAKALGLKVPQVLLARADEVIE
jgi:putative tryptophan/tyrosine transport system substrate-binding protein